VISIEINKERDRPKGVILDIVGLDDEVIKNGQSAVSFCVYFLLTQKVDDLVLGRKNNY
jgi:hypothetical protein